MTETDRGEVVGSSPQPAQRDGKQIPKAVKDAFLLRVRFCLSSAAAVCLQCTFADCQKGLLCSMSLWFGLLQPDQATLMNYEWSKTHDIVLCKE